MGSRAQARLVGLIETLVGLRPYQGYRKRHPCNLPLPDFHDNIKRTTDRCEARSTSCAQHQSNVFPTYFMTISRIFFLKTSLCEIMPQCLTAGDPKYQRCRSKTITSKTPCLAMNERARIKTVVTFESNHGPRLSHLLGGTQPSRSLR